MMDDGKATRLQKLIGQALPMTAAFIVAAAALIGVLYQRGRRGFGAALVACSVAALLLGLNVSVIGLVEIRRGSLYLLLELFGLILVINAVYAVVFFALEQ